MTHPRWKYLVTNPPSVLEGEYLHKIRKGESGFHLLMRPGQKKKAWMKNILQKLTKPGNLVVGAFVG